MCTGDGMIGSEMDTMATIRLYGKLWILRAGRDGKKQLLSVTVFVSTHGDVREG